MQATKVLLQAGCTFATSAVVRYQQQFPRTNIAKHLILIFIFSKSRAAVAG